MIYPIFSPSLLPFISIITIFYTNIFSYFSPIFTKNCNLPTYDAPEMLRSWRCPARISALEPSGLVLRGVRRRERGMAATGKSFSEMVVLMSFNEKFMGKSWDLGKSWREFHYTLENIHRDVVRWNNDPSSAGDVPNHVGLPASTVYRWNNILSLALNLSFQEMCCGCWCAKQRSSIWNQLPTVNLFIDDLPSELNFHLVQRFSSHVWWYRCG